MSNVGSTRHAVVETAVADLTLVMTDAGLSGIYFPGHWTRPDRTEWGPRVNAHAADFAEVARQLHDYLAGSRCEFDLQLHLVGTPRAMRLWQLLQQIPYGQTTTYAALADRLGDGISARAVGQFVGHNPVSIVVPCHRVVGSSGSLTGYAGGLERKRQLLELEGALAPPEPALW